jgi:EAL domain-containing protein (putative c-di-GMP-specific phosphodiesterase class I)/GGDEF domain-containing protein
MPALSLMNSLPDLFVLVRRDGLVLEYQGGHAISALKPKPGELGQSCQQLWPDPIARLLIRLTRKAIVQRAPVEATLNAGAEQYELRANPVGPDRALICVRPVLASPPTDDTDTHRRPQLDRRQFLRRYRDSMAQAALRERVIAVAVIQIDGVSEITQMIESRIAEKTMSVAIARLPTEESDWYLGQLSEQLIALVMQTADRSVIEARVSAICASLRQPIAIGDAEFHLTPYAGVAILGRDATIAKVLLEHARFAATEAKRSASPNPCFFSDTLRLRALARFDIARELREAIENRDIRLRYTARHELSTGRLVAWVGYLSWQHPVRGEVRPAEFLRMADSTGLTTDLSRAVMRGVTDDFIALAANSPPEVRISFGPLRHHLLQDDFVADIEALLQNGHLPARRLELRVAERTLSTCDPTVFFRLRRLGVHLIVDEVGRGIASLDALARAPVCALQLDRAWVSALQSDAIANRVCQAGFAIARALGLTPIATGVDDERQREALLRLDCQFGSGDLYRISAPDIMNPLSAKAAG